LLKTAHKYWDYVDLPEIPNKCWGVMDPKTLAEQIDDCKPVPIWHGQILLDVGSHAVVVCGYELANDTADSEMDVLLRDPDPRYPDVRIRR
jgi:hypothetical protein